MIKQSIVGNDVQREQYAPQKGSEIIGNQALENLNKSADLIIKLNDNPIPNLCPLCDRETNPNIGAEIFLAETDKIVCFDCAEIHSPILAGLITFGDLSRIFQISENRFAEKWENAQSIKGNSLNKYQSFGIQKEARNG